VSTSAIRAIGAVVLVFTQACYLPIGHGAKPEIAAIPVRNNGTPGDKRTRSVFGPKTVHSKEKPTRLIARDGTSCVVSPKKFDSTALGASVWCTWMDLD
jgi:hypothetical protein